MSNVQRFLDKVESNDNQGDSIAIISSWLQVAPSKVWITLVGDSKDAAVSTHTHTYTVAVYIPFCALSMTFTAATSLDGTSIAHDACKCMAAATAFSTLFTIRSG
jgi:hypothetical protein